MPTYAEAITDALSSITDEKGGIDQFQSFVSLRNVGSNPFVLKYANRKITIPPGAERQIPFAAAVLAVGDPRAVDSPNDRRARFRTEEYQRLRCRYGIYEHESLIGNFPQVEMYAPDGARIPTIIEDPDATFFDDVVAADVVEAANLDKTIANVQRQLELLLKRRDVNFPNDTSPDVVDAPLVAPEAPIPQAEPSPVVDAEDLLKPAKPKSTFTPKQR